jgi:phage head maturation protease
MTQSIELEKLTREERLVREVYTRAEKATVGAINEEARTAELSFGSEFKVERWFGTESLEMTSRAADLKRLNNGGAVLSDHNTRQQIGVVTKAWIGDDKRAYAIVKFSKSQRGQEEFQDVIDGIRTNVSFGYRIHEYRTEKGKAGAPDVVTATRWEALEVSLVAVPADPTVGIGRAEEGLGLEPAAEVEQPTEEIRTEETPAVEAENTQIRGIESMSQPTEAVNQFSREAQLIGYGEMMGDVNLGRSFAADPNKSLADLQRAFQDKFKPAEPTPAVPTGTESTVGMNDKEVRQYSIARAILAQADGNWKGAEFEREVSDEIGKRLGRESSGFFVPAEVQNQKRDLSATGGGTSGGYLVGTEHMPQSFIDLLRSKAIMLSKAGVTVLSGLVRNPSIPRQDARLPAIGLLKVSRRLNRSLVVRSASVCRRRPAVLLPSSRVSLLIQSQPSIDTLVRATSPLCSHAPLTRRSSTVPALPVSRPAS